MTEHIATLIRIAELQHGLRAEYDAATDRLVIGWPDSADSPTTALLHASTADYQELYTTIRRFIYA